ncbi:PIN domain-containing protein [Scytonema sp. NUACC26]|uniref:PIN domain-containing protein n=1 Tax=Scytonema sp. NUACC26 TaxID=3140176 RepID=UPI0034DBBB10
MTYPMALLDACVLYSAPLRDLLMWLAIEGVYAPKWSEMIHQEWIQNLLEARPDLLLDRLERTSKLMNARNPDALVKDFEHHIPSITLPDADDRHIVAAAITGNCDAIVTFNLKDFPDAALAPYRLTAVHPDSFILQCFMDSPTSSLTALRQQHQSLRSPPCTMAELLQKLIRCGLSKTVAYLQTECGL